MRNFADTINYQLMQSPVANGQGAATCLCDGSFFVISFAVYGKMGNFAAKEIF